jgi:hypothetical protein
MVQETCLRAGFVSFHEISDMVLRAEVLDFVDIEPRPFGRITVCDFGLVLSLSNEGGLVFFRGEVLRDAGGLSLVTFAENPMPLSVFKIGMVVKGLGFRVD